MSIELFFFQFLFSGYCCSAGSRVVSIFLLAVISFSTHFSLLLSSHCIDASTMSSLLVSPLPPSFHDTYSLSTSSLGCNAICKITNFLLWFICLSYSLVHFKNSPEYVMRGTVPVFIPLISFLLYSFVSSSFLVLLNESFLIFFFLLLLFDSVSF